METTTVPCPSCHLPVLANFYYCPNCGTALRSKDFNASVGSQIGLYVMSILLGPLVLHLAIRNIRKGDPRTKMSGWIAIIIMVASIVLGFVVVGNFMNRFSQTLNQLDTGQYTGF